MAKDTLLRGPVDQLDYQDGSRAFGAEDFDRLILSHGTRFIHYRGMKNPVGAIDPYDGRRPEEDHSGASNGMIYTRSEGFLVAVAQGNNRNNIAIEGGVLNASRASITCMTRYLCCDGISLGEPVYLAPMDRLFLEQADIWVVGTCQIQTSETGIDRLKFPAKQVKDLVDSANVRFECGRDFTLTPRGDIKWKEGVTVGPVFSVRYLYQPYFYVDMLNHELRLIQKIDPVTGERRVIPAPKQALIVREHVFHAEKNDPEAKESPRQAPAPASGLNLGSR